MATPLHQLLDPDHVIVALRATSRTDVLTAAVDCLVASGALNRDDAPAALQALVEREQLLSTGLEKGLAVPHGFTSAVSMPLVVVATLADGIDFEAMDGELTTCAVVLLEPDTPEAKNDHLMLLATIADKWMQPVVVKEVMAAKSGAEMLAAWG